VSRIRRLGSRPSSKSKGFRMLIFVPNVYRGWRRVRIGFWPFMMAFRKDSLTSVFVKARAAAASPITAFG
jgi:hypothetical protein